MNQSLKESQEKEEAIQILDDQGYLTFLNSPSLMSKRGSNDIFNESNIKTSVSFFI
jgi:hypothetical protein